MLKKFRTGFRVCVRTQNRRDFVAPAFRRTLHDSKLAPQRLKPHSFCRIYVVAKATTHNDSAALTQTLKPMPQKKFRINSVQLSGLAQDNPAAFLSNYRRA